MFSYFLDWIYPPKCVICSELLTMASKDRFVCQECRKEIPFIKSPVCLKCGKHLEVCMDKADRICPECNRRSSAYERGYAAFSYDIMKKSISHFKFKCFKNDSIGLARLMYEFMVLNFEDEFLEYDIVIPIPIHMKKRKARGFNQSELLAEELCRLSNKKYNPDILRRVKNTIPQSSLDPIERRKNLMDAFDLSDKNAVIDKNILLIDDIFTTGNTINECAKILYREGAVKVSFFVLSVVSKE